MMTEHPAFKIHLMKFVVRISAADLSTGGIFTGGKITATVL